MKNYLPFIFALGTIMLTFSCSRQWYHSQAYYDLAPYHKTIAILPPTVETTGRLPEDITEEQVVELEEYESRAFQAAMFTNLVEHSGIRPNDIRVSFQHYATTQSKLKEAGIPIRDSWEEDPVKLAKILGVDAVFKSHIRKEKYLTDLESFGIEAISFVANILSDGLFYGGDTRTGEVYVNCAVLDAKNGVSVWATDEVQPTSWDRKDDEVIQSISNKATRRFPYRNKDFEL